MFVGLNGSQFVLTSILLAYLSDLLPPEQCILAYGLSYLMMGLAILIGLAVGLTISTIFDDHFNFYIMTAIFVIAGFYLYIFVPESLDKTKTKKHQHKIS